MDVDRGGKMPGYTGYIMRHVQKEVVVEKTGQRAQIPGYQGFIQGIKSENLFGATYGKITDKSAKGSFSRGIDIPPVEKYSSITSSSYVNQRELKQKQFIETQKLNQTNQQKAPEVAASSYYAFWGTQDPDQQNKCQDKYDYLDQEGEQQAQQNQDLSLSKQVFFGEDCPQRDNAFSSEDQANIFGMSYEEARLKALEMAEELKREQEKRNIYRRTQFQGQ